MNNIDFLIAIYDQRSRWTLLETTMKIYVSHIELISFKETKNLSFLLFVSSWQDSASNGIFFSFLSFDSCSLLLLSISFGLKFRVVFDFDFFTWAIKAISDSIQASSFHGLTIGVMK